MDDDQSGMGCDQTDVLVQTVLGKKHVGSWVYQRKKEDEKKKKMIDNWCYGVRLLLEELGLEKYWRQGFLGSKEKRRKLVTERIWERENNVWWQAVQGKQHIGR